MTSASVSPIRQVLQRYRGALALTYLLFGLEMLGSLLRPYFIGRAIDGLLAHRMTELYELIVVHLTWLVIGAVRHAFDTRAFSAVYTAIVTRLLDPSVPDLDVSRRSAYSSLSREVVEFLQYDFVYVIEACYNVIGSLIILFAYERRVVALCLVMLVPVVILSRHYGRRTAALNVAKHDELERQVDVLAGTDAGRMRRHYEQLRHWQVRLSDLEAWNFGVNELLVLVILTGALLASTIYAPEALRAGVLVAMYNYVLRFTSGLDTIPYTIQRLSALRDILRRIDRVAVPTSS